MGGKLVMGLKTPARKNWGKMMKGKICWADCWLLRFDIIRTPKQPPRMEIKKPTGMINRRRGQSRGI